jgi:hypothetical protein
MGTTLDITKVQKGPSKIWFGLAIPGASSYLTIGADGTPDATQNPNAKLVGLTDKGAAFSIIRTITDEMFDEVKYPLAQTVDQLGGSIKCDASQVLDVDLLTLITAGIGTALTPTAKLAWTLGDIALTYTSIAVIAPTKNDPTKFVVFHLYRAYNKSNIDMELSRQARAKIPLEFQGSAIATRASTDLFGCLYITT